MKVCIANKGDIIHLKDVAYLSHYTTHAFLVRKGDNRKIMLKCDGINAD